MKGPLFAFVAATLLTVTAGVLAQSGGFPSRPKFLTVTATSSGAPAQYVSRGTSATAANISYVEFQNSASSQTGFVGDASGGDNDIYMQASTAGANVRISAGTGGNVLVNGALVPRHAYGIISETGGVCSISGADANTGLQSVSYAAVPGRCNITLNAGFTIRPSCVIAPYYPTSTSLASIGCTSTTACVMNIKSDFVSNASGTATVSCFGT